MILDKLLFEHISTIGKSLLKKSGLENFPKNIEEMSVFLETSKKSYEQGKFDGLLFANILFNFVSSVEVRDRHVTARVFEDIFSYLFSTKPTDKSSKNNPIPPKEIMELNKYNHNDNWKISSDLAGNKREKADIAIGNYHISLKTLKGFAYDSKGKMLPKTIITSSGNKIKNEQNNELNIGSLSFRALLKGILTDEELNELGDRKKGLGSGSAIRKNVLEKIKEHNKVEEFKYRLNIFMHYIYDDDLYIVLKSHYQIKWILIPAKTFIDTILTNYEQDEYDFEKIWYRWENNNLRMYWNPLLDKIKKYCFPYKEIVYNLGNAVHSNQIETFNNNISTAINDEIYQMLNKK